MKNTPRQWARHFAILRADERLNQDPDDRWYTNLGEGGRWYNPVPKLQEERGA